GGGNRGRPGAGPGRGAGARRRGWRTARPPCCRVGGAGAAAPLLRTRQPPHLPAAGGTRGHGGRGRALCRSGWKVLHSRGLAHGQARRLAATHTRTGRSRDTLSGAPCTRSPLAAPAADAAPAGAAARVAALRGSAALSAGRRSFAEVFRKTQIDPLVSAEIPRSLACAQNRSHMLAIRPGRA